MRETDAMYVRRFEDGTSTERAAVLILQGAVDAPHHRQWFLDQAVRLLTGDDYEDLILAFQSVSGEEWDTGVAP